MYLCLLPRGTCITSFIKRGKVLESWFASCKVLKDMQVVIFCRLEGFIFGHGSFLISKQVREFREGGFRSNWPCFELFCSHCPLSSPQSPHLMQQQILCAQVCSPQKKSGVILRTEPSRVPALCVVFVIYPPVKKERKM